MLKGFKLTKHLLIAIVALVLCNRGAATAEAWLSLEAYVRTCVLIVKAKEVTEKDGTKAFHVVETWKGKYDPRNFKYPSKEGGFYNGGFPHGLTKLANEQEVVFFFTKPDNESGLIDSHSTAFPVVDSKLIYASTNPGYRQEFTLDKFKSEILRLQEKPPRKYNVVVPDFTKAKYPESDEAVNDVRDAYANITKDLLSQLKESKLTAEQQCYVIYLLGELRAENSVVELVKRIDFRAPVADPGRNWGAQRSRWHEYPAVEALEKIGRHSAHAILDAARQPQSELRQQKMAQTLKSLSGVELANDLTEQYIKQIKDPAEVERLRAVQNLIQPPKAQ
ncbi:MAG: hypothetical protein SGJ20_19890 [Planctomycetota bacterium]|nr:hypothetical protein [Planctomycetota bacterium]